MLKLTLEFQIFILTILKINNFYFFSFEFQKIVYNLKNLPPLVVTLFLYKIFLKIYRKVDMRQTTFIKPHEVEKKWFVIDAESQILGRLAAFVASRLRGKHSPLFTPNVDMGDKIIIINAEKILLTAKKEDQKLYYRHSGYPGGLKVRNARELRAKKPIALIEKAVYGMLPHTKLGDKQRKNLYVYAGTEHPHQGQNPEKLEVKY